MRAALRNRLAGAGFRPEHAALIKSSGREGCIKSQFKTGR